MRVILFADWLDKFAGAEKVIKVLNKKYNFENCYVLVNIMKPEDLISVFGKNYLIKDTVLRFLGKRFRGFFPFFYLVVPTIKIKEKNADLIISSSHCIAKGFNSKGVKHICYFQARNAKYIWDEVDLYFTGLKSLFKPFVFFFRVLDKFAAKKPDLIIANSFFVSNWIREKYNIEAPVVYPPVDLECFSLSNNYRKGFVSIGRLEPYKRFDILIESFNKSGDELTIVGDGSCRQYLESISCENIKFVGFVRMEAVKEYISNSRAFVYAGIEDFGIAPIEAQAVGTPVICLAQGGTAETVIDKVTGIHFQEQSVDSFLKALIEFKEMESSFNINIIRENALRFSEQRFLEEFGFQVNQLLSK